MCRKSPREAQQLSLDEFRADLADGLADASYQGPEAAVLAEEVRLSRTQSMLQCPERGARRVPKAIAVGRVDPRRPSLTVRPVSPSVSAWQKPQTSCTACTTPPPCGRTRTTPHHRPRSTRS
jgi:hypothetical protein